MASVEHVIRIPRNDTTGQFVIINVTPNGSHSLDLRLLATEGENPYVADGELRAHKGQ